MTRSVATALLSLLLLLPLRGQAAVEMENAIRRVQAIVNQPVTPHAKGPGDNAAVFQPGWFHEGASAPDFDHVDVRATQQFAQYARWPFVTSDVTPGVMFAGSEVEFNAMTKLFYVDRSLPKKKLTEAEMLEINDLYRVIGKCVRQIKETRPQGGAQNADLGIMAPVVEAAPMPAAGTALPNPPRGPGAGVMLAGGAAIVVLVLLLIRARGSRA